MIKKIKEKNRGDKKMATVNDQILEVLKIYEKEHPENIGKLLYKNTNHRHQ